MTLSRRKFLAASVLAAATTTLIKPEAVAGSAANSVLELGLIGCGGRGEWITDVFKQNPNYRIVAVADYFQDRVDAVGNKTGVPADRRYTTLSGYKRLLESKLDVVVIETPPSFHPVQAAAAVEAGKHVFLAKPIAVDVPGCATIEESGKKASEKKLAFLVDFQTRANQFFREAIKRVHAGDLGELVSLYSYYPWSAGGHDTELTGPESYLRNWYQSMELSGDCIVEQDIHTLDVATWIVGKNPLWAAGTGGRKIRKHGDIHDHFNITYGFPGDVSLQFASVKFIPGVKDEIVCRAWGTGGALETNYFGDVNIRGNKPYDGGNCADNYWAGTVTNAKEFAEAITNGDFSNPTVAPAVRSNLTCILGRDAVRLRKLLTWDEMMQTGEHLKMKLDGLKS
ncbi:MAG: Gfo/Idh/MocA family oxidoreductase [Planctomycetaceae bacterium]|nr:Gfo/Idh/MocA family oxidoreductase [Planctomycetaceae bacterium]